MPEVKGKAVSGMHSPVLPFPVSLNFLLSLREIPFFLVRPGKWDDPQVGFRGSNASGGRIVLLPGTFWAHGASKRKATLGASLLPCVLQCFRA